MEGLFEEEQEQMAGAEGQLNIPLSCSCRLLLLPFF
jgi:hypothetical protein